MSLSVSPSLRLSSDRRGPLATGPCRNTEQPDQPLTSGFLPAVDVLEFFPCPAALWSEDHTQCVPNRALFSLLGSAQITLPMDKDLWLSRVERSDRESLLSSWNRLQADGGRVVCHYRFLPFGVKCAVELEEVARRFSLGGADSTGFLSCYRVGRSRRRVRGPSPVRTLVHKIGNHLQAVRGEVDLLRLVGDLPQKTFESITGSVESIHDLVAQIEDLVDHDCGMIQQDGADAPGGSRQNPGDRDREV